MFWTRVATAAVLLPLFAAGLFFLSRDAWAVALSPLVLAGAWEWGALAGWQRLRRTGFCALQVLTALPFLARDAAGSALLPEAWAYVLSAAFWIGCVPFWLALGWRVRHPGVLAATGWLLLVPTWLALVRLQAEPLLLLAVMAVVWVADSAAYFAGRLWGRHKLAPAISPGKTWEGVAGAAVAVAVYHALVWQFGFSKVAPGAFWVATALVVVLLPLSIIGDLFESWLKRQAGVKDSGRLLPGHGGVLDRIDALTSTLPLAALVVALYHTAA